MPVDLKRLRELAEKAVPHETMAWEAMGPVADFLCATPPSAVKYLLDEIDHLRATLQEIACGTQAWERDEMIDLAVDALTAGACPICGGIEGCDHTVRERFAALSSSTPTDAPEGDTDHA